MNSTDTPLSIDDLTLFSERIARLPPADVEWVGALLAEVLRARRHETDLLAMQSASEHASKENADNLNDQLAQVALDTAEWLRTLWDVGYMGAGSFRSAPRSAFPSIDLDDVRKSSLFARIRQGKHALPFPPPTRHGRPWHDVLDDTDATHQVAAEIIRDEEGRALAAIIEACAEWQVVEEPVEDRQFVVQHQGKGPRYRLHLRGADDAALRREPPALTCPLLQQERGGFHSHSLPWQRDDGSTQVVTLRAATWERAMAEAEHWLATHHPELYGQVRFIRQ
ncbi:MAG TPA: hypothetical protein PK440_10090 [Candidatus Accumulibacter phosphatis]|nr:MAG: hypothetical protein AW07_00049 [Candidatus Accumulibacter sp. SK-11]HAY28755.1 hypothetical protein [Accumulibacter sp.]HRL74868.1 hypothetical protein [Candidatus Accumulibacter phosphatis]HCN68924.1 hypothetical protein [Accumulibacter sp.]HCV12916.1 hypothetical protein [Accumulibacter sp.]